MKTINDYTNEEIAKLFNDILNEDDFFTKQAKKERKRREKMNIAMADFLNLPECGFIPAK